MLHLQRLETTLSVCAEEPDHSQLFTHLGRMALEFNRLASKVHKNEQRTSILQVRPGPGRAARDWPCGPPLLPPALLGHPGDHRDFRGHGWGPVSGFLFKVVSGVRNLCEGTRKEIGKWWGG